jgi:Tfp pilus assembly ATPase PilU
MPVADVHASRGKAVADGAISYLVDHFVSMRVAKATLVVAISTPFKPYNVEHRRRRNLGHVSTSADGIERVENHCRVIVTKASVLQMIHGSSMSAECYLQGDLISESSVFRQPIYSFGFTRSDQALTQISSHIIRYKGSKSCPKWLDIEPGG